MGDSIFTGYAKSDMGRFADDSDAYLDRTEIFKLFFRMKGVDKEDSGNESETGEQKSRRTLLVF